MSKRRIRVAIALCAVLALAACATTEVARWAAPPGKEILIGQGGAVETVLAHGANDASETRFRLCENVSLLPDIAAG